ncbi:unnamed protein product, partial [Dicrocoelium dendriticum]
MQALSKPLSVGDSLLKEMWLRRLPRDIRNPLYANDAPLSQLADIADRIWESNAQISQVQSTSSTEVAELRAQVAALANRLEKLTHSGSNRRNRSSSRSPPRSRSKSPLGQAIAGTTSDLVIRPDRVARLVPSSAKRRETGQPARRGDGRCWLP